MRTTVIRHLLYPKRTLLKFFSKDTTSTVTDVWNDLSLLACSQTCASNVLIVLHS